MRGDLDLRPHRAMVAVVMAGSLALIGVITLNHMPAADAPQIARIDLPRGLCTRPTDGNVLHITVAQHQGGAGQFVVDCKTYGPRGRQPKEQQP